MSGERILILTASHLCRNPRVVKEAATLGAAGYDVTVLSVSSVSRFEQLDVELMRGQPFRRLTVDYSAPGAQLADLFQRTGTRVARELVRRFGLEHPQSLGPAGALLLRARRHPAELTIVHTEIPLWAAQALVQDGRRIAADMEDWHTEDLLECDRRARPLKLLRRAEAFALRHAVYSSATSQSMADALARAYGCPPPIVLRNCFPLQPASRLDGAPPGTTPRFIWFSQTIGPGRGLESFIDSWGRTTCPSEIHLLGQVGTDYCRQLLDLVPTARRNLVHFIPAVPPGDLPARLAEFDLGLALEPRQPLNRDLTITNKIFQYLNAGLAIIATDTAGQREVMHAAPDSGLLIPAGAVDSTALARQLDEVLSDPARLRAMQTAARRAAETRFCWEHEAPRLLGAVQQALTTAPRR